MYQLDSTAYWFLIACAAVLFWKVIIPASWKIGTVFIRTVFLFLEAKGNDFPLWPVLRALPKTLWRVWRADLNTCYDYTDVCRFNYHTGKFESRLTTDHEWLNTLALLIRRGQKKFTLTLPTAITPWLLNQDERVSLTFHIRTMRFIDATATVLMISENKHVGIDGLIGHSLQQLIRVLEHYAPDVFAVVVETPSGVISHISTLEAEEVSIKGKPHQLFVSNPVKAIQKPHLHLVNGHGH